MDSRRRDLALSALVFLVPVLLYLRTTGFQFIWDDDANVTSNALLFGTDQLRRIWLGQDIYQYYPLTFTSYWLQDRLFGLSPAACHAVNVALQGLVSALLYRLLRRLSVPGAFVGALLFSLHPLATETVAWVTERKNLLAAVFILLSALAYTEFAEGGGRITDRARHVRPYVFSLLFFLLAVLSKTHAVVLPASLLLLELWRRTGPPLRAARRLLPFLLLSIAFSILTVTFETRHVVRDGAEWEWAFSVPEKLVLGGKILTVYLGKILWPHPLAFIYDPWAVDPARIVDWIPSAAWGLGLLALAVLAWRQRAGSGRRWAGSALFVAANFVVWLAPVLGVFRVYFMRYAFVQDHFAYFALLVLVPSVVAAVTWGWDRLGPRTIASPGSSARLEARWLGYSATLAIGALLSVLTWKHQGDFRDLETLWVRTVEKSPRAWMAWTNLGVHRSGQGRHTEAADCHRTAISIDERRAEPHVNLGFALEASGDLSGAIAEYREGARLEPEDPVSFYNLGNALVRAGRPREAVRAYESALGRNRRYPSALNGLGVALAATGRMQSATEHWAEALILDPGFQDAYGNLARALESELSAGGAVDLMRRVAAASEETNPAVEVLLARANLRLGDLEAATLAVDRAEAWLHGRGIAWLEQQARETRLALGRF